MRARSIIILFSLIYVSCQSRPTKTDYVNGGVEHGFLPPPVWNQSMQNLKQDMLTLEPYIFDSVEFSSPSNHEFLGKQIHKLAEETKNVKHDPIILTKDPTVRFVAAQFADEIQKADENFQEGWMGYSRSQLAKATSFCLECHTRIHDGPEFSPHDTARPYLSTLPVVEQIEFMIAFRQFNAAYDLALQNLKEIQSEKMINTSSDRVARLALLVSVQYMQDIEKTNKVIKIISQNTTLPLYLKKSNLQWKKSMANWHSSDSLKELPAVRNMLNNRVSEIEDMRAIPALLNLLTEGQSRSEQSESLYLTGQSYENLNKISTMSLHENYYESCARKAPESKWAQKCFDRLLNSVTLNYSGSGGTRIPPEIKSRLDNLQKVIKE